MVDFKLWLQIRFLDELACLKQYIFEAIFQNKTLDFLHKKGV